MNKDDIEYIQMPEGTTVHFTSKYDPIVAVLIEIRDELKKLNARQPKPKTRRESVLAGELPMIAQLWNEWADPSLPRVISMETGSARYKNCQARWAAKEDKNYWVAVIRRMNESSFCLGKMETSKWQADIEFLTRPDVHARILEGKYDDKKMQKKVEPKLVFNEEKNGWEYQ
jgi:hypothetical protein